MSARASGSDLGSLTVVVAQDAAEMLGALDGARDATDFLPGLDEPIRQPVMIAFPVIIALLCARLIRTFVGGVSPC